MPKGAYTFLTIKDLMRRLGEECKRTGQTPPSRPTLYRMEKQGIWRPTSYGANGWRKFTKEDLEIAVRAISKESLVDYSL